MAWPGLLHKDVDNHDKTTSNFSLSTLLIFKLTDNVFHSRD